MASINFPMIYSPLINKNPIYKITANNRNEKIKNRAISIFRFKNLPIKSKSLAALIENSK